MEMIRNRHGGTHHHHHQQQQQQEADDKESSTPLLLEETEDADNLPTYSLKHGIDDIETGNCRLESSRNGVATAVSEDEAAKESTSLEITPPPIDVLYTIICDLRDDHDIDLAVHRATKHNLSPLLLLDCAMLMGQNNDLRSTYVIRFLVKPNGSEDYDESTIAESQILLRKLAMLLLGLSDDIGDLLLQGQQLQASTRPPARSC